LDNLWVKWLSDLTGQGRWQWKSTQSRSKRDESDPREISYAFHGAVQGAKCSMEVVAIILLNLVVYYIK